MVDSDLLYLHTAVELAARGMYSCTPNPRVGCIIVRNGEVLGRGWHVRAGEAHAEVNAIADATSSVAGSTVYVSLEPCAFQGRTPPCTEALIQAGVARVVAAMTDPHPKVAGQGFAALQQAGIAVDVVELAEARTLNAGYLKRQRTSRPLVRLKTAISLDGRSGMASGESQWITSVAARSDVQAWRARSCAILSGSGTLLADDARLTVRAERFAVEGRIRQPLRVIVDSRLQLTEAAAVFSEPGATLVVHSAGAKRQVAGAEHLAMGDPGGKVDLAALLDELGARGCNELLVEAGAGLLGALLEAQLWDELLVYLAPKLLGSDARPLANLPLTSMSDAVQATIADCVQVGDDLRIRLTRC
ncbi:MAG: bifunctional diaminohydroxyphosphoribosylaminopyrimidine deaminase/5-amino-6-(5-phosphoribosylamino)uracil reductase RibD [Gammaproteobacteria bacterium]|nr:bifunctional diaminohydroxyphosphoribosylaminopyrimidine deaminase/5-amino-6-(5-phosphoribosylamino)uracil reductase RibD [Gammaproteobacteria bacterium]